MTVSDMLKTTFCLAVGVGLALAIGGILHDTTMMVIDAHIYGYPIPPDYAAW